MFIPFQQVRKLLRSIGYSNAHLNKDQDSDIES